LHKAEFPFRSQAMGEESQMRALLSNVPQVGTLRWIGLRPTKREALTIVEEAELLTGKGLRGDRYKRSGGKRQVSLIQKEHLPVIAALAGRPAPPELLRRNLVIEGIPLSALRRLRFSIGDAILEGSERCAPCSRMEEALGDGGYAAMLDMGGILARVIQGGTIRLGDEVRSLGFA
jgi:MOSC domain-containing protein YiiM